MASFSSAVSALSAVTPILGSAAQFINAGANLAGSFDTSAQDELRRRQQRQIDQLAAQQGANLQIVQQDAALKRQEIEAQAAIDDQRRQQALKRAVARQRAQFGAMGISNSAGGSGEAVLLGLFDQSEDEKQQAGSIDQLRLAALDQNLEQKRGLNLLQTQQLLANQALERALF